VRLHIQQRSIRAAPAGRDGSLSFEMQKIEVEKMTLEQGFYWQAGRSSLGNMASRTVLFLS
jgi:hypothetical protein